MHKDKTHKTGLRKDCYQWCSELLLILKNGVLLALFHIANHQDQQGKWINVNRCGLSFYFILFIFYVLLCS